MTDRKFFGTKNSANAPKNGQPMISTRHVKIRVFADEMTSIVATLEIAPVLLGWTLVPNEANPA